MTLLSDTTLLRQQLLALEAAGQVRLDVEEIDALVYALAEAPRGISVYLAHGPNRRAGAVIWTS